MSTPSRPQRKRPDPLPHRVGRQGVAQFEQQIAGLGWDFHEQSTIDFGIDGAVETADDDGRPSGALIAVQVKGGVTEFEESSANGWWFRFEDRHYRYWMKYCLPVYVVLVDTANRDFYWQRVTAKNVVSTGKNWKIEIPRGNDSAAASSTWHLEAGGFLDEAYERASLVADLMPPAACKALDRLAGTPDVAAQLTAFLGGSAGAPELAVRSLLDGPPQWLKDAPGCAWEVVAAYASEHGLNELAGAAFERGAQHDPKEGAGYLIAAATHYIDLDRDRARTLLARAVPVTDKHRLSLALARAMVEHPEGDAHPIDVPAEVLANPDAARDHGFAQSFLGGNATRRGAVDEAVAYWRRALEIEPTSTDVMLKLSEAHVRRAITARARPDDVTLALRFADDAYRNRRSWKGPSAEALVQVMHALLLRGDTAEILRRGRPAPDGVASLEEARDPQVLENVAVAAVLHDDLDVLQESIAAMPDNARRAWLELETMELDDEGSDAADRVEAVLDRAIAEDDPHTIARAVLRLSHLGRDRVEATEGLRAVGIVPDLHVRLPRAILKARANLDEALPDLRALAHDDAVAAETLVHLLGNAGRFDDALVELDALPQPLRVAEHSLRVGILMDAGRTQEVEAAAADALTDTSLGGRERLRLYRLLAAAAGRRDQPDRVIAWCRRALDGVIAATADPTVVWWLIGSQLDLAQVEQAWEDHEYYAPVPATEDQIAIWGTLHRLHGWTDPSLREALELARSWADDALVSAQLLAEICLFGSRGTGEQSAGTGADEHEALQGEAWEELARHCDRHGDASPIQRISFNPEDPGQMLEMFRSPLAQRAVMLQQLALRVLLLQVPLGLLSEAANRPYALAVIHRAAGITTACEPVPEQFDLEVDAATAFLRSDPKPGVVTDATALHLSGRLGVAELIRDHCQRVQLPRASRHDIQRSLIEARQLQKSPGSVQWDTTRDRPVVVEVSPEEQNEVLQSAEALDQASRDCEVVIEGPLTLLDGDHDGSEAWLAPLQYAADTKTPLWSDDVVLRRLARGYGVPTFGTLAMVHALHELGLIELDDERQEEITKRLLAEWVVDGPWTAAQTIDRAQQPEAPLDVLLAVLARPWRYVDSDERADALRALTATIGLEEALHRRWFNAVSFGLSLASTDPARTALLVAASAAAPQQDPVAAFVRCVSWLRELFRYNHFELDLDGAVDTAVAVLAKATGVTPSTYIEALQANCNDPRSATGV